MKRASVISSKQTEVQTLDYHKLLEEGIETLQNLAGDNWTDFNDHDPGVTILQQLCYALTDLGYRTEHPIEDILEAAYGEKPFAQAFFTGDKALVCDPVTVNDYRKLLLNQIAELRNVWLEPVPSQGGGSASNKVASKHLPSELDCDNLYHDQYRVHFDCFDPPADTGCNTDEKKRKAKLNSLAEKVSGKISCCLVANRAFGTYVSLNSNEICAVPRELYTLGDTELVISADADPVNVIATALFQVDLVINPYPAKLSIDALMQQGHSPDELFEGPPAQDGGIILDVDLLPLNYRAPLEQVVNAIRKVEGVLKVNNAVFVRENEQEHSPESPALRALNLKETVSQLRVTQGGNRVVKIADETDIALIETSFRHKQQQYRLGAVYSERRLEDTGYEKLPRGNPNRHLNQYRSIQHLFPAIYGIGAQGVPVERWIGAGSQGSGRSSEDGPQSRQAKSRQLKAYLLFFEQLIADYLAQLANSARLLSLDDNLDRTLFSQSLAHVPPRDDDPPDIAPIFVAKQMIRKTRDSKPTGYERSGDKGVDCYRNGLNEIMAYFDRPDDRQGRALDHLLARFNQSFPKFAAPLADDIEQGVVARKRSFLKQFPELSRRRGSSIEYVADTSDVECVANTFEEHKIWKAPPEQKMEESHPPIRETLRCITGYEGFFYVLEHRLLGVSAPGSVQESNSLRINHKKHKWQIHLVKEIKDSQWPWEIKQRHELNRAFAEYERDGVYIRARLSVEILSSAEGSGKKSDKHESKIVQLEFVDDFYSHSEAALAVDRIVELLKNLQELDQYQFTSCWLPDPFFAPRLTVLLDAPVELNSGASRCEGERLPSPLEDAVEQTLRAHLPAHLPVHCLWLTAENKKELQKLLIENTSKDKKAKNDCIAQKISEAHCQLLVASRTKLFQRRTKTQIFDLTQIVGTDENNECVSEGSTSP